MSKENNQMQAFGFGDALVRVVDVGGETWWVAKDVCACLGLTETHKAVGRLDEDEKGRNSIPTLGGEQEVLVVSESGLYSLVLSSKKPEARAFKRWVTGEVLPQIRKTGSYGQPHDLGALVRTAVSEALGGQQGTPRLHGPLSNQGALRSTIVWARNAAHMFAIRKGREYKWPDNAAVIGMWTAEDVAIVRATLDLLVTAWGFEPAELYASWTRAGWAHVDKQAIVFGIRRSGGRAHCVVIRRAGWEAAGFGSCPAGDLS